MEFVEAIIAGDHGGLARVDLVEAVSEAEDAHVRDFVESKLLRTLKAPKVVHAERACRNQG